MGMDRGAREEQNNNTSHQGWAISRHAYSDLTKVSPVVFLYLLKECYVHGTCKATVKFVALQQRVHEVLYNSPRPGPAVFVALCLYVLPVFESYSEGLSHLIISALRRFLTTEGTTQEDLLKAKCLATQLFITVVGGNINHDEKVLIKILEAFDIGLIDIENLLSNPDVKNDTGFAKAKTFVERYILKLIERQSYMPVVTLLQRFCICESGESFLIEMIDSKQYRAAEKWAMHKGKPMVCILVQEYIKRQLLKHAYDMIKLNHLRSEFPEVYYTGKESSLKKLAEKGCWDVAELRAKSNKQLLEYLVYLAMEAGYTEKVDELCDRYSLKGFVNVKEAEAEASVLPNRYLHLDELAIDNIIWVDEASQLKDATCHITGCKVVGLDCEWKPNYEKGGKDNKVSIIQIASEKMVFIIDLIKLSQDVPDILDNCLSRILHSPGILKLGYNFQCDIKQLAQSYGDLQCFKHYEMLLDIQNVFKEAKGGLSGLAKSVLGVGLNKTRRSSNWEQRPLTQNQLEYAALDAVVLIHIFAHVRDHSPSTDGQSKMEWKSHIISHMDNTQKSKKQAKNKKKSKSGNEDSPLQLS